MRDLPDTQSGPAAPVFNPNAAIVQSIKSTYAFIEFEPDGTIIGANKLFLDAVGYTNDEIAGRHHRIFMPPGEAETAEYRDFWARIGRGEAMRGTFMRVRKDGSPIWISATYSPIFDREGNMRRAFKTAIDLSEEKRFHHALTSSLQRLADGDVTQGISASFSGDHKETVDAFNQTVERLRRLFGGIADGTADLNGLAAGLTESAGELRQRTDSLAASIGRSSASVRSLTSGLQEIAKTAQESESVARRTADGARAGGETVGSAVASMKAIEAITAEISKITKIIEGFAFQTNLLSINAAVEAARAGDAGKGFGVVAGAVRELADQSAKASREIAGLIARSTDEVALGVAQVEKAGKALEEVTAFVAEMVESSAVTAQALSEQSRHTEEVDSSLAAMERETDHLTRMAGGNGAAASNISLKLVALDSELAAFRRAG